MPPIIMDEENVHLEVLDFGPRKQWPKILLQIYFLKCFSIYGY